MNGNFYAPSGGDSDLVVRLKRRDSSAMALLYDQYGSIVYSLILRVVGNRAVAEDLVQETFLRVWNQVSHFDGERGSIGSWMLAIARNMAIDHVRSARQRTCDSHFDLDRVENPALFSWLEDWILNLDHLRKLKGALENLKPNQRTVIEMAYYEDLSQTEISKRLKQPLGTVKTWMRTALMILRDNLGDQPQRHKFQGDDSKMSAGRISAETRVS